MRVYYGLFFLNSLRALKLVEFICVVVLNFFMLCNFQPSTFYCKAAPHTNLILYSIYPRSFPPMPHPWCLILSTDL
jgi:hypothetical protein